MVIFISPVIGYINNYIITFDKKADKYNGIYWRHKFL